VEHTSFNPRARVGRDKCFSRLRRQSLSFNPRARVGRDSFFAYQLNVWSRFNPRARVGRDRLLIQRTPAFRQVSIHAPAWGATRLAAQKGRTVNCFNPRARVGRDWRL